MMEKKIIEKEKNLLELVICCQIVIRKFMTWVVLSFVAFICLVLKGCTIFSNCL